jgi:hypothetical protein
VKEKEKENENEKQKGKEKQKEKGEKRQRKGGKRTDISWINTYFLLFLRNKNLQLSTSSENLTPQVRHDCLEVPWRALSFTERYW